MHGPPQARKARRARRARRSRHRRTCELPTLPLFRLRPSGLPGEPALFRSPTHSRCDRRWEHIHGRQPPYDIENGLVLVGFLKRQSHATGHLPQHMRVRFGCAARARPCVVCVPSCAPRALFECVCTPGRRRPTSGWTIRSIQAPASTRCVKALPLSLPCH